MIERTNEGTTDATRRWSHNWQSRWSHHPGKISSRWSHAPGRRQPLIVLAGDVGTGKTELAESVGDSIARKLALDSLTLYPLSLSARGRGLVGEMTTLITQAFDHVRSSLGQAREKNGKVRNAAILLVDEADAIAQSRELAQMHHEDRAGVNAVIRAVDSLRRDRVPVLTIMCTNRVSALDPAIARRAAYVFSFVRPDEQQRAQLLSDLLAGTEISAGDIAMASSLLGPNENRRWGATYSDLRQRFVPDFVLAAYAGDTALTRDDLIRLAEVFAPTRPFGDTDG